MINPWLQFFISAVVIVYAGSRLTKNASVVAKNTGISTAWAGVLMLPLATSMPELVTTIRAAMINTPDLALGNIFGSCLFNLALLSVIDLLQGRGALTSRINNGHILTASLSIVTLCLAAIAMLEIIPWSLGWVGYETLIIVIVYFYGSRLLYRYEKKQLIPVSETSLIKNENDLSTGQALRRFIVAAVFIITAGVLLTDASNSIALETGLSYSFVGTLFLAISTSLPETVTTITALKLGHTDMAVANIFGANFMNLFIVFFADLFFRQGPLLHFVTDINLFSALMIMMFSAIIILGNN